MKNYHQRQGSVYAPSELQQFMNDFDKKGPVDVSVQDTGLVHKPKMVLKDSSKYVKKKPVSKMQATSIPGTPTGGAPGIDLLKPPTPQATQN